MQKLQRAAGFTLIELMIAVAIIGVLTAMAAPMVLRYRDRESARTNAQNIARILSLARSRAMDEVTNHFVIFRNPVRFNDPFDPSRTIGWIVRDNDADWGMGFADEFEAVSGAQDTPSTVAPYGVLGQGPYSAEPLPLAEDQAAANMGLADLASLPPDGTTFPRNPAGLPAVGFNTRGIPVSVMSPGVPGSGAGAFYVTENNNTVYAVILLPLGGVRVRVLSPGQGWL